jgi:hypothetical protein
VFFLANLFEAPVQTEQITLARCERVTPCRTSQVGGILSEYCGTVG